jgi:hypothetical protein
MNSGHNTQGIPGTLYQRQKQAAERAASRASNTKAPGRITSGTSKKTYSGAELSEPAVRQGADDHMALPSRHFDTLRYRDGREVSV